MNQTISGIVSLENYSVLRDSLTCGIPCANVIPFKSLKISLQYQDEQSSSVTDTLQTISFFCIFASEYRISDPMSACRNSRNKTVEVLPASSGPDSISNQVLFSCKLHLITETRFTVMQQLILYRKRNASVSRAFSLILPFNIH